MSNVYYMHCDDLFLSLESMDFMDFIAGTHMKDAHIKQIKEFILSARTIRVWVAYSERDWMKFDQDFVIHSILLGSIQLHSRWIFEQFLFIRANVERIMDVVSFITIKLNCAALNYLYIEKS